MAPRVHVTFGDAARIGVTMALAKLGLDERVMTLDDDLGHGPIDPYDLDARTRFELEAFMDAMPPDVRARVGAFWERAAATDVEHVLWTSRRSVQELTGYMEWISRCAASPLVVDISAIDFGRIDSRAPDSAYSSVGVLSPDHLGRTRRCASSTIPA